MTLQLELGGIQDPNVRRAFELIAQQFPIGPGQLLARSVTSLPASPVDGMEIYYTADATNGIIFHLRYRAASASSFKWESVGGSPLYAEVATQEAITNNTYVALATAGPSIALPLAGDYDVEIGFTGFNSNAGASNLMSYDIGGTGAVDADAAKFAEGVAATDIHSASRWRRKTGLTAVTLTSKYKSPSSTTATFLNRWIRATPIRVG